MIEGVLRLDERRVGAFMTPRTQIVWIDVDDSLEVVREKVASSGHSRFPVCQGSLENVLARCAPKTCWCRAWPVSRSTCAASSNLPVCAGDHLGAAHVGIVQRAETASRARD